MNAKQKRQERDEAIARLKELVKPGDQLVTVIRNTSASGMSRSMDVYMFYQDKAKDHHGNTRRPSARVQWLWLTYNVAKACGFEWDHKRDSLRVGGCGMDMGFHVVYTLGRVLFPKGGHVKHSQRRWQEERNGNTKETDGGYLLSHRWLR